MDLEWYRKQAKELVRAFAAGEDDAIARAEAVLGVRARERFRLSDAQHVLAVEAGRRSWAQLARDAAAVAERVHETGLFYREGEPVRVRVRRRDRRYEITDDGRAAELAGLPPGWYEPAERLVRRELALNVSRGGVVFVPAVEGGLDVGALVRRVGEASRALYQELLELGA